MVNFSIAIIQDCALFVTVWRQKGEYFFLPPLQNYTENMNTAQQ